jgi:lipid-A-disaccharide synthase
VPSTSSLPDWVRRSRALARDGISTCDQRGGTATVRGRDSGVPLVVAQQARCVRLARSRVPSAALNLIAGAGVVPERIQAHARPAALAALVARLLRDPASRAEMRAGLASAIATLGAPGAAERVADLALEVAGRA